MTSPVKYMVVDSMSFFLPLYRILDTSILGDGKAVCYGDDAKLLHRIAKFLNEEEGYQYGPE